MDGEAGLDGQVLADVLDQPLKVTVVLKLAGDFIAGVNNGGMIAAELLANLSQGAAVLLLDKVHGHLPGDDRLFIPPAALNVLGGNLEILGDQ